MENPFSKEHDATNEGGVRINAPPLMPTTTFSTDVVTDQTADVATPTDADAHMMDASRADSPSASEASPFWQVDGSFELEPAKSAKPRTPSLETKNKRAAVGATDGDEGDVEYTPAPKSASKTTPNQSSLKQSTPKTPTSKMSAKRKAVVIDGDRDEEDDTLTRNLTGRVRKPPKDGIAESNQIPTSYEECSEQDRMLVDMRKNEKYTWPQVREAWFNLTGRKVGNSTLPNRLERLRANFSVIKEEDRKFLLKAKIEIEKTWEKEKWERIATRVLELGGDSYGDDHLRRQWKVMMVAEGLAPPVGLNLADWEDDDAQKAAKAASMATRNK